MRPRPVLFLQRGTSHREDHLDTIVKLVQDNEEKIQVSFQKARNFSGSERAPRTFRIEEQGEESVVLQLLDDEDGETKSEKRASIEADLRAGMRQKDIAERYGLTRGRISQIKKELQARAD